MPSNQRPWGPNVDNIENKQDFFLGFHLDKIKQAVYLVFAELLKDIQCGNRSNTKQIDSLDYNISIFEQLELVYVV